MGKRILVADDSRTIQQAFAMVMDGSGYTLSFAKSVEEALSVARRDGRPDLVLSDAALGTGSGYDLCAQLKAEPSLHEVPVYILASSQTPYDEARARKVGADGYLAKPFESQALLDAVASALSTPTRRVSASMPSQLADVGDDTSRFSEDEVIGDDDDSYGEITIERGPTAAPAPAPAPTPSAWATRPPSRPSVARPLPAPTPAPPSSAAARPPMITTPRPSTAMPTARTGSTPAPTPPAPSVAQPRHTVMGFPSVRQAIPPRATPPAAAPIAAPVAPVPSRPATLAPATASLRPPVLGVPAPPAPPAIPRPAPTSPSLPGPAAAVRPPAPRIVPPIHAPAPAPQTSPMAVPESPLQAQPTARRLITPLPGTAQVEPPAPVAAALSSAADKIDQKISALAARGPEYEAIAKLSREIIEQVVWEVVPELAEAIIRQEIDRLASAKK